jgi:hypothetical protein
MTYPGDSDATRPIEPAADATRTMSAPAGRPPAGGPPPRDPDEGESGKRWWWIAGAALLVGVLVGGAIALAAGGDDETATTTTTSSTSTSTTSTTTPPPTSPPPTAPAPPGPVSGLSGGPGGGSGEVSLSWNSVQGAVSYRIYRSSAPGVNGSLIASSNDTTYDDTPGATAYYQVSAVGSNGLEGSLSSQACAAPVGDSC